MAVDYDLVLLGSNLWSFPLAVRAGGAGARVGWVTMSGVVSPFYLERMIDNDSSHLRNWRSYLEARGIDVMEAQGKFVAPLSFQVGHRSFTARHFVVCAPPRSFPNPNQLLAELHSGNLHQSQIKIAGGNYFSCAIAQFLNRQGIEVELLIPQTRILPKLDGEVSRLLQARLEASGISIRANYRLNGTETAIFPIFPAISSLIKLDLAKTNRIHFLRSSPDITSILQKTIFSFSSIRRETHPQPQILHTNPPLAFWGETGTDEHLITLRSWGEDYFLKVTCERSGKIKGLTGIGQRAVDVLVTGRWTNIKAMPTDHTIVQELIEQFSPPTRPNLWLNICRDFNL